MKGRIANVLGKAKITLNELWLNPARLNAVNDVWGKEVERVSVTSSNCIRKATHFRGNLEW